MTTPLVAASKYGHIDAVRLLLEHNATVDGDTLYYNVSLDHIDIVSLMLDYGVDANMKTTDGYTTLYAAACDNIDMVRLLIKHGADVHAASDGCPALFRAIICGRYDIAQLLLDRGTNINYTDKNGGTILHYIASDDNPMYDRSEMIKWLEDRGIDISKKDNDGYTAHEIMEERAYLLARRAHTKSGV